MKKLFLFSAVGALATFSASAQSAIGVANQNAFLAPLAKTAITSTTEGTIPTGTPSAKGTAGGSRKYSYTDFCVALDATFANNGTLPYLWGKGDGMGIYSDGSGGIVADTIALCSYGMTFDPAFSSTPTVGLPLSGFNEPSLYPASSIVITRGDAYKIDSLYIYGFYGRNTARTTTTDTMRVAIVYGGAATGSDLPVYYYSGMMASFGFDTVRAAFIGTDTTKNYCMARGTTRVIKDILMTTATLADTLAGGINEIKVAYPGGFNVPAGNVVGISVTFLTGDTYTPYVDTIFYGSARSANPFGRGMFRPSLFEQNVGGFPRYYPGYYNTGFVKFAPDAGSYRGLMIPSYAYTAPFTLEIPNIDVVASCTACKTIDEYRKASINDKSIFADVNAYPNPATSTLNVPFTIAEKANVTVTITNMVGQVLATQNIANVSAGQKTTATFNTNGFATGVYLYTIEANGQRISNRFTVAN